MLKMVAQQEAAKDPRQWLDKGATPLSLIASMLSCMAELMKEAASIAEGDAKTEQSLDFENYDWWRSQYNRWNDTNRKDGNRSCDGWNSSWNNGNISCDSTGSKDSWNNGSGLRTTEMNQVMPVRPLAVRTTRSNLSTPFLKAQIPGGERSTRVPRLKARLLQASIPGSERSPHRRTRPLEGLQDAPGGLHALGIIPR